MKVERNKEKVRFDSLGIGEVFEDGYYGVCIKIALDGAYNAFSVSDNGKKYLDRNHMVSPHPDAVLLLNS